MNRIRRPLRHTCWSVSIAADSNDLRDNVEMYWAEKARRACHRNVMSIYNLHKLYDAEIEDIPELSQAKYGVRYFCPRQWPVRL